MGKPNMPTQRPPNQEMYPIKNNNRARSCDCQGPKNSRPAHSDRGCVLGRWALRPWNWGVTESPPVSTPSLWAVWSLAMASVSRADVKNRNNREDLRESLKCKCCEEKPGCVQGHDSLRFVRAQTKRPPDKTKLPDENI